MASPRSSIVSVDESEQPLAAPEMPTSPVTSTPANGTRIPRPAAVPKKGILKRSGSVHVSSSFRQSPPLNGSSISGATSVGDMSAVGNSSSLLSVNTPILQLRRSPLRGSPSTESGSKIPKLSVTWWETSSVCGEAPRSRRTSKNSPPPLVEENDRSSCDEDDGESVQSYGSSIVGNWWFGRTTRYVPHCQRRHLHGDDHAQYLTPTQRKNKEIGELKTELKTYRKTMEEKDKHLQQLRERLTELERVMDQGGCLTENQRLQEKLAATKESWEKEKRRMAECFEEKLRRLVTDHRESMEREANYRFELDELRSSMDRDQEPNSKLSMFLDDRDSGISSYGGGSMIDAMTMTDANADPTQELQAYRYECAILRNRVSELEFSVKRYEKDASTEETCGNKACIGKQRAQTAQLEAYKNECLVWRTKAAEMEIALKQQIAAKNLLEKQGFAMQQMISQAQERQKESQMRLRSSSSLSSLTKRSLEDINGAAGSKEDLSNTGGGGADDDDESVTTLKLQKLQLRNKLRSLEKQLETAKRQLKFGAPRPKGPCSDKTCLAEKAEMRGDNERLEKESEDSREKQQSLERQLADTQRALSDKEEMLKTSQHVMNNIDQQLSAKRSELDVTQLTLQKTRDENEKLRSEIKTSQDKLSNLESVMAECGVIIGTPSVASVGPRRKFSRGAQPQQIFRAREIQTDLNWSDELNMESELARLRSEHAELQTKYDLETMDLEVKLEEIGRNLLLKNNLVNTLTNQIQLLNDDYEAARSGFERERLQYSQKLHDLELVAQRVPFLEQEVATARDEVQLVENTYEKEKGRFEQTMEVSLAETMKSYQQTGDYYKSKLDESEQTAQAFRRKAELAEKELSDERMRLNLEKSELQRQLQAVYIDMSGLHAKIHAARVHQEIQASPELLDKGISCGVEICDQVTEITVGDFFDERDQQLKILQGELNATRRQVEILQGKLLGKENVQEQLDAVESEKHMLNNQLAELQDEIESAKMDHQTVLSSYETRYKSLVEEKERMARSEKQRIHDLETAFEQVGCELDSVIKRYETEKLELKVAVERIGEELEIVKAQNRRLNEENDQLQIKSDSLSTKIDSDQQLWNDDRRRCETLEEELRHARKELDDERQLRDRELVDISALETQIREMSEELETIESSTGTGAYDSPDEMKSGPETILQATSTTPTTADKISLKNATNEPQNSGDPAIVDMRSKVVFLLKENDDLRNEFNELKDSVASLVKRHNSLRRRISPTASVDSHSISLSNPKLAVSESKTPETATSDEATLVTASATVNELDSVRDDLERIVDRFDLPVTEERAAERREEEMLMDWLKNDLRKEKYELDVMIKWYGHDKPKLESELKNARSRLIDDAVERIVLEQRLDAALGDLKDVGRELQLYKTEDSRKADQIDAIRPTKWRSCEQLQLIEEKVVGDWHRRATLLARNLLILHRKLDASKVEIDRLRRQNAKVVNQNVLMTAKIVALEKGPDGKAEDLDELKRQLHQAERCAARLETEATQWMHEVSGMKQQRQQRRRSFGSDDPPAERPQERDRSDRWVRDRRQKGELAPIAEQSPSSSCSSLGDVAAQRTRECAELKEKLEAVISKHDEWVRRQQQQMDALRERHQTEMEITKRTLDAIKARDDGEHTGTELDTMRRKLEETTKAYLEKSAELERLEKEVIFLKARLATTKEVNCDKRTDEDGDSDSFDASSFWAFVANLNVKHEIEMKALRQELEEERTKRADLSSLSSTPMTDTGNLSARDLEEELARVREEFDASRRRLEADVLALRTQLESERLLKNEQLDAVKAQVTDTLSNLVKDLRVSGEEAEAIQKQYDELQSVLQRKIRDEQKRSAQSEERSMQLEKELKMLHEELKLKSANFSNEITKLKTENADLRDWLSAKTKKPNPQIEAAAAAAQALQQKVDQLMAELEEREKQHQEMYLLMFRKGQEAARMEISTEAELEDTNPSTSSSEWSFEYNRHPGKCSSDFEQRIKRELASKTAASPGLSQEEITLRFLRDAVYYFLVNRDPKDHSHLQAVMSILKFSDRQRENVLKTKGFG